MAQLRLDVFDKAACQLTLTMKIVCLGAGPAGLLASYLISHYFPQAQIEILEKRARRDIAGLGWVWSQESMQEWCKQWPRILYKHIDWRTWCHQHGQFWDTLSVEYGKNSMSFKGHPFYAFSRQQLVDRLLEGCEQQNINIRWETPIQSLGELKQHFHQPTEQIDLIINAQGVQSPVRQSLSESFGCTVDRKSVV